MIKMNKKGFSLVELLATITILGILSTTAIIAYSRYKQKAKVQVYDTLAKSSMHAMEEYLMDNPGGTNNVTINFLTYEQYLERPADASDYSQECVGTVQATETESTDKGLDAYDYTVTICCSNYEYNYQYQHDTDGVIKTKVENSDTCTEIKTTTASEKAAQAAAEAAAAAEEDNEEETP